jgi:site-specific DNA recombinase
MTPRVEWFRAALLITCRRHGIQIHVTSHGRTYDLAHPRDWRSLAEDGVDSAYESEKTSQRILRAMTANAVAGRPHGRCPYGYVRTYDPRTGSLTGQAVDPQTAPVVREVIQRIAASEPVSVLTEDLNRRGIPSPAGKVWQRAVVRKVALNPAYIAQRTHDGETHQGTWEPLVSEAEFYGARSVLLAPGRVGRRPGKVKHLPSYIARCGVCGGPLGGTESRGYFCSDKHCTQAKLDLVDSVVEGAIIARLEREDILADLAGRDDAAASEARDEVARLRARLDDFRDTAAMGELTASSLAHVEARLVPQIL